MSTADFEDILWERFGISADDGMMKHAIREGKRNVSTERFGFVSGYLSALVVSNPGTTTAVVSVNGVFDKALMFPGICAAGFAHSTKVVVLDACHTKTKFGGVFLVMTILD